MDQPTHRAQNATALILSGGGARAAYQIGVLLAVTRLHRRSRDNPFPIICGTSAGGINAAALAAGATDFRRAVRELARAWLSLTPERVYRVTLPALFGRAAHWIFSLMLGGLGRFNPRSFLDNRPLTELLRNMIDFGGIGRAIEAGQLKALSITASGYTTGQSVSFFQGDDALQGWQRAQRLGMKTVIEPPHLLASSAIPFVFPAARIHREYFGDGSVRQVAPISPAIHLGACRVLVIGVAPQSEPVPPREKVVAYPSLAQVAGHLLDSIFIDGLEADLERVRRINRTLERLPAVEREQLGLRQVEVFSIKPSRPLERLAMPHRSTFPPGLRFLLGGLGAFRRQGSIVASYVLFHHQYARELIRLGYRDAMAQREALAEFLNRAG
ncbi:patatin-like phospholipase family protein [Chitiniphilus eburneus]|uniref:Patatin-like phospholipase family protein n=1 Tax=Chitiniphilus eburneus TaxID=2571148 RepID=A0A4U0Q581_9NEIS|nr:patatin-like phospholipase family protein [Chitiniphilus eburneus]TJZ76301.1 patatin-like phospholipase family protein [Chitiniphilus eburneus]